MSVRVLAQRERYRADMDDLRALAVAMVVLYHAWPSAMPGGFAGVRRKGQQDGDHGGDLLRGRVTAYHAQGRPAGGVTVHGGVTNARSG